MNQAKTFFLMVVLTIIFVASGSLIGGQNGAMIASLLALVMNFVYWFCDKIVLKMYGARQVSEAETPQLYSIVSSLAQKTSIPIPKVYIIKSDSPKAFATGRNPSNGVVAVTTGIAMILSRDKLEGFSPTSYPISWLALR